MTWKSSNGFRDGTIEISTRNLRYSIRRMLICCEADGETLALLSFSIFMFSYPWDLPASFYALQLSGTDSTRSSIYINNHRWPRHERKSPKSFSPFGPAGAFDNFHIFGWIVRLDVTQVYQQTVAGVKKLFQVKINIRRDKNVELVIKWHSIGKS